MKIINLSRTDLEDLVENHKRFKNSSSKEGIELDLNGVNAIDFKFTNLDLTGVFLRESSFKNIKFINCDLYGFDPTDSIFENCSFIDCKINKADIYGVNFLDSIFDNSEFSSTTFLRCTLKNCKFVNSDLKFAHFSNCELNDVDFGSNDRNKLSIVSW